MYIKTSYTTIYVDPKFIKEFAVERGAPNEFWVVLRYQNGDNVYIDLYPDRDLADKAVYEFGNKWMALRS